MRNLINKRFGKLVVTRKTKERASEGSIIWECKCDCGQSTKVPTNNLISDHTKSCGCFRREISQLAKGEAAFNYICRYYKSNAKKRGLEFKLTKKEIRTLLTGNCFYCDLPPKRIATVGESKFAYNGIDRVDNTKGYTRENCVPCCYSCNVNKKDYSVENMKKALRFLGYRVDDRI